MFKNFITSIIGFLLYQVHKRSINDIKVLTLYMHNPEPKDFMKICSWLKKKGFVFINTETLVNYILGDIQLDGKTVHFSFDDGWQSNISLLPIIDKYKIPVTVFVSTEPMRNGVYWWSFVNNKFNNDYDKVLEFKQFDENRFKNSIDKIKSSINLPREAMTSEEVYSIDKNPFVDIESHTVSHPVLTNMSDESLMWELSESKKELEVLLKRPVCYFSYPNGDYTQREIEAVSLYYKAAFTIESSYPQRGGNVYKIPRIALDKNYWANLAKVLRTWPRQ